VLIAREGRRRSSWSGRARSGLGLSWHEPRQPLGTSSPVQPLEQHDDECKRHDRQRDPPIDHRPPRRCERSARSSHERQIAQARAPPSVSTQQCRTRARGTVRTGPLSRRHSGRSARRHHHHRCLRGSARQTRRYSIQWQPRRAGPLNLRVGSAPGWRPRGIPLAGDDRERSRLRPSSYAMQVSNHVVVGPIERSTSIPGTPAWNTEEAAPSCTDDSAWPCSGGSPGLERPLRATRSRYVQLHGQHRASLSWGTSSA
jgi:hypothetical protein